MARNKPNGDEPLLEPQQSKSYSPLRDKVKEALLSILEDRDASAAARASAGRTLLEHFTGDQDSDSGKRGGELTLAELDREIARRSSK